MNPISVPTPSPVASPLMADAEPVNPLTLVLGGGCFWCTEAVFVRVRGVLDVESGYSNGDAQRFPCPTYDAGCTGETGYNEAA